jgi:2-amino-4-hydroxy-6-hydroxymethyldihydropteridine diphosphokinase
MGRVRTVKDGPRIIDIDILLWDGEVIQEPGVTVPHPRMHERRFVLEPLNDIAPEALHPLLGATVSQLLGRLR